MNRVVNIGWIGCVMMTGCTATGSRSAMRVSPEWSLEATPLNPTAAELSNSTAEHLAWAKALRSRIPAPGDGPTIDNTLRPFNEMMMHLDAASNEAGLLSRVHPDAAVRKTAEESEQAVQKVLTELKLDRKLFESFAGLDTRAADPATQFLCEKVLRDFRRAGVAKSDAERTKIAALNEEIVKLGQEFAKNVRENEREVAFDSLSDLEGMPADWLQKHQPAADGKIHVSTRYPDYYPFQTYAHNADGRQKLYKEFKNRGYPKNMEVLKKLFTKRHELANTLGYRSWAEYITEDKMIGTAANARSFIDRIAEASKPVADRDYDMLLGRKRKDSPKATKVEDWENAYYQQLVKVEQYQFDAQAVRPYFNFSDVQQGLFEITGKLFGIRYQQVERLTLWHPDVTAWDVFDGRRHIGRFYLDLHPRENKYGHAAQFDYRTGVEGERLPQAVLVCNFPNPRDGKDGTALMEHSEVVTFFHEFGHLLHALFAGHQPWIRNSGISTEWDFVEAPSQMLEEWCFDAKALQLFAKHDQTREPISAELVARLRKARDLGKGVWTAHQDFYAALSLNYYEGDPTNMDLQAIAVKMQEKFSPFPYVADTHFQCSFGHLDEYSAIYYTYLWSLVISKDLFSEFQRNGLFDPKTAKRYRLCILEPGGSKPAAQLVQDFLGRPHNFASFEAWLNGE